MKQHQNLVLASASPRRKQLLESMGIKLEVVPSQVAELGYGGDPMVLPLRIALQKLKAVRASMGAQLKGAILAADTIVAMDGDVFGKPDNPDQARAILKRLSGKIHQVVTGFRIETAQGDYIEEAISTNVTMMELSPTLIDWYVESGEPMDKAGAYGIQGLAGAFVSSIHGSYTNVVGLPMSDVLKALVDLDIIEHP
ncbi:MAG: Maf family protein [Bdellovibrionota bacterium]